MVLIQKVLNSRSL